MLAVKGIGGYHLACDAADEDAVAGLRRRKRRGAKPFAVMVGDLGTARRLTVMDPVSEALLSGPRRPVVLLPRRGAGLAPSVAPGNPDLGVLLAYTPLHVLLLGLPGDSPGPEVLVMTSGNLGGEPIAFDDDDALQRLAPLADAWLRHDRPIRVPCDDSVVRVVDGEELPIRRSRGYAPLPVALPREVPATLAVGADLKNTCAVAEGRYAWLSQHVGDMDDLATLRAFDATVAHLSALTQVQPGVLAADAHPGYRSSAWAREHAGSRPLRTVQHHHAHIAAVMGEHGLTGDDPVIGFAFDGTGYGTDGAVWGGEVLLADYKSFTRAGAPGLRAAGRRRRRRAPPLPDGPRAPARRGRGLDAGPPAGAGLPRGRAPGARPPAADGARLRADLQHGPALRRRLVARRGAARRRLRGRGGDRAGGAVPGPGRFCGIPVRSRR